MQFSVVAGREPVRRQQGRATTPKGILQLPGISGFLGACFRNVQHCFTAFKEREATTVFEGMRLGIDMHPYTSSYLSPFSCNRRHLPLSWGLQYKGAKQPSLPDVTSTQPFLSCPEEVRIGSCSQRRWGRKVRLEQASQQLKGLEKAVPVPADLPLTSLTQWSLSFAPATQLPKTTGQGKSRYQRAACPHILAQTWGRQHPQHLCLSRLPSKPSASGTHKLLMLSATGIHNYSLLWVCKLCLFLIHGNEVVHNAKHCLHSYKMEVLKKILRILYNIRYIRIFKHIEHLSWAFPSRG